MVKKRITYAEAKQVIENHTNEKVTYASVTNLMSVNNRLIERLKATENLLREIANIQHTLNDMEQVDDETDANETVLEMISKHFQNYGIKHHATDSDPDEEERDRERDRGRASPND